MPGSTQLTRDEILNGLEQINDCLADGGVMGEICIYGGACMCLAFSARVSTKDVDAVFRPAKELRKAIFDVGLANGWTWNWMNDNVAGFLSTANPQLVGSPDLSNFTHLKILFPRPEYMLAMKCLAARAGSEEDQGSDLTDALWLCRHLNLSSEDGVRSIVRDYYPDVELSDNTAFFIGELVEQLT